jgi:hypothetical protein
MRGADRIVIVVGAESQGEPAHRASVAVAARLGTDPVTFRSHHGGFLGDDFGVPGQPERLRKHCSASSTSEADRPAR